MLPGFRFLFAAIMLSSSMLIFGLGAAALLRAAHGEFASIPSRRTPPETVFAQRDDARPALAMLRVEPSVADGKPENPTTSDNVPMIAVPHPEQAATAFPVAGPEKGASETDGIAVLTDAATPVDDPPSSGVPKSDALTSEIPVQAETVAQADAPLSAGGMNFAAVAEVTAPPDQAAVTAPDPAASLTGAAETRIATLGGPPVTIEARTPSRRTPAVVKKPAQTKHVVKRRRIVQRARVVPPAPQRPQNPFGNPFGS